MSSSWIKRPLGSDGSKIEIRCSKEQAEKIKDEGCVAYTESCDAAFCDTCAYSTSNIKFIIKEGKHIKRVDRSKEKKTKESKIYLYTMKNYLRQWSISKDTTLKKNKRIEVCGIPMKVNMLNRWYHVYEYVNCLRRSMDNNFEYYRDIIINNRFYSKSEVFRAAAEFTGAVYFSNNGGISNIYKNQLMKYLSELEISVNASDTKQDLRCKVHKINEDDIIEYIPKKSHVQSVLVREEKDRLNNIKDYMTIYLSWLFSNMYLEIVTSCIDSEFITGDNPVIVDEDTIIFPFSPKVLLVFRERPSAKRDVIRINVYNTDYIEGINLRIKDNCKKYTVSK